MDKCKNQKCYLQKSAMPPHPLCYHKPLKKHRRYSCMSSNREFYPFLTERIFIFAHFSHMENFNTILETYYL